MEELNLDERKLKEIEHSRKRRSILQGFERRADTHPTEEVSQLQDLVRDSEAFKMHFSNMKFYSVARASEAYYQSWLRERCKGRKVLDYCCGSGENGIFAAQCGGDVIGIDISPEGVKNARINAALAGVQDRCRFDVMDGEALDFPDDAFDIIVEYGALHHVDFPKAMSELRRVIRPDGEIICIEALKHNPLIHLYRKRTMHLRTEWEVEHILTVDHLRQSKEHFGQVNVRFFHLAALCAVPFRKTRLFKHLLGIFERVDDIFLRSQLFGKYGWIMVFTLSLPKKLSAMDSRSASKST